MSWNVNGTRTRKSKIIKIISEKQPDILSLKETQIRKIINILFPEYDIYRTNRLDHHKVVANLMKFNLQYIFIQTEDKKKELLIQITAIRLA